MKTILLTCLCALFLYSPGPTIYDFKVDALDAQHPIDFASFKGKKILIVNTACRSPYTFQLEGLQRLHMAYGEKLVVVAFPAGSDFGDQELKTNREIREFMRDGYGLSFPIAEKVTTVGTMRHPIFSYLIEEARKSGMDDPVIKWNFTKILLDENGALIRVFEADITPMSSELTSYLNNDRNWSLN